MKFYQRILWIVLLCVSAGYGRPLNVLMIAIDDMNNWIGALAGPAQTPHIDRLARQGLLFTNSYCVVPACNPSRVALMTGQRPETTGQFTNEGNFRERPGGAERVTLAQYLRQFGYEATAAGKIFHQPRGTKAQANPLSDPISWNDQRKGSIGTRGHNLYLNEEGWAQWHGGTIKGYLGEFGVWGPIDDALEETGDFQSAAYCADYLKQPHGKPFFLACGIFRPHSPQLAPQKYFDRFPLDQIALPLVPDDDMQDIPKIAQKNFSTPFVQEVRKRNQWKLAVQGYLASMAFADDCVGHLLEALDKSDYRDNTIVLFWTDHGWQLGHKWRWEKFSLWKQGTQSPLIIRTPGMKTAGQRCDRAVSFLDIYPTVADLLGLSRPEGLEGTSLVPLLENPTALRSIPAVVTYNAGNHSVVLDHWNYIRYKDGSEELYDHRRDPDEFKNLAGLPRYRARMDALKQWLPEPYSAGEL